MWTVKTLTVNPIEENCYIVSDDTKECAIIDCGAFYQAEKMAVKDYVESQGLKPVLLLNTHLHFDHIWGNAFIHDTWNLDTCANTRDQYLYHIQEQEEMIMGRRITKEWNCIIGQNLDEGDRVCFGNHTFRILSTPGHTPGGICFYCPEENALFSGDSLFYCSIGRTDFPNGDQDALVQALREKVLTLPDDTTIYPGHGPSSKVSIEKRNNPYL